MSSSESTSNPDQVSLCSGLATTDGISRPDLATEPSPFQYEDQLDNTSIRLLLVHPDQGQQLECSLVVEDFNSCPDYDALSYTWGDPQIPLFQDIFPDEAKREIPILCHGEVFRVTANLHHALERVRGLSRRDTAASEQQPSDYLWIDAICINQRNEEKKSAQMAMMHSIYKRARRAIAWLGKEDIYTERAIGLIEQLSQIAPGNYSHHQLSSPWDSSETQQACLPLAAFFDRPYWRRAWVLQELFLAAHPVVYCGRFEISWQSILQCSVYIEETGQRRLSKQLVEKHLRGPHNLQYDSASTGLLIPLLCRMPATTANEAFYIMKFGRSFDATDPKDYVYATLGILLDRLGSMSAQLSSTQLLEPDYSKSVADVYMDYTQVILSSFNDLLVLSEIEDKKFRSRELSASPSWVPDLSVASKPRSLLLEASNNQWHPAGQDDEGFGVPLEGRVLRVTGAVFDTIASTAVPFDELFENHRWIHFLDLIFPYLSKPYPLADSSYAEALWRTMIADTKMFPETAAGSLHPAEVSARKAFNEFLVTRLVALEEHISGLSAGARECESWVTTFNVELERIRQMNEDPSLWQTAMDHPSQLPLARWISALGKEDQTQIQVPGWEEAINRTGAAFRDVIQNSMNDQGEMDRWYRPMKQRLMQLSANDPSNVFFTPRDFELTLELYEARATDVSKAICERKDRFVMAFMDVASARRLFITEKGFLGMGSESVQVGDQVWLLKGTLVPFLLWPTETSRLCAWDYAWGSGGEGRDGLFLCRALLTLAALSMLVRIRLASNHSNLQSANYSTLYHPGFSDIADPDPTACADI